LSAIWAFHKPILKAKIPAIRAAQDAAMKALDGCWFIVFVVWLFKQLRFVIA
jgi:hypothetical protein